MYYAIIDSASLKNPLILNKLQQLKVTIQYEPESSVGKFHYNYLIQIKDSETDKIINNIQTEIENGWYLFFWNDKQLHIVFNTKQFLIDLPSGWTSDSYTSAQEFGKSQGISETYLNFKKYFQPYLTITN